MSIDNEISNIDLRNQEALQPRYDMSEAELDSLEQELFTYIEEESGGAPDVYTVWLQPDHPFSNIIRQHEVEIFPEIPEIVEEYEDLCLFLAVVDMRASSPKVVHGFRFSGKLDEDKEIPPEVAKTGMPFIDDIIQSGQGLTTEGFTEYYEQNGIDLNKCISVETNFRIREADDYNGVPISQVGYLALFNHVDELGVDSDASIFAHLNTPAIKSLGAIGVTHQDIAGVPKLKTPTIGGEFDTNYSPVDIPFSKENVEIFRQLAVICAPKIEV